MEELLKQIMGDSYKEDMTQEEIQNFFKKTLTFGGQRNIMYMELANAN